MHSILRVVGSELVVILLVLTVKKSRAGFTGLSTKSGDSLTVNFKNCKNQYEAASAPQRMYCALNYDAVLNIKDQGIELLD